MASHGVRVLICLLLVDGMGLHLIQLQIGLLDYFMVQPQLFILIIMALVGLPRLYQQQQLGKTLYLQVQLLLRLQVRARLL